MKAIVKTNFKTSKGNRVTKGTEVTIYRAISPVEGVKLYEIVTAKESFTTTEGLRNRMFTN